MHVSACRFCLWQIIQTVLTEICLWVELWMKSDKLFITITFK